MTADLDFETESDDDLLEIMSWKDDSEGARAAWAELYRRHVSFVHGVLFRAFGRRLGEDVVKDVTARVLVRAYESSKTFTPAGGGREDQRLSVRAWLSRIARNLAIDELRSHWQRLSPVALKDEDVEFNRVSDTSESSSIKNDRVREAINSLASREQDVLLATMQYYDPSATHQKMPDGVVKDLASQLNTTTENIRQIRRRALLKLKQMLAPKPDSITQTY